MRYIKLGRSGLDVSPLALGCMTYGVADRGKHAWQFVKMTYTSRLHGWVEFVSMQNHYNLLQREDEREMVPFCTDQGIAVLPWSPLARGLLTRDWQATSERSTADEAQTELYASVAEADRRVVDQVKSVAVSRGIPMAQVALAWLSQRAGVTAPIVGATKPHHLTDAVAALDLHLDDREIELLEKAYVPHPVAGYV